MKITIEDVNQVSFLDSVVLDGLFEFSKRHLILIVESAWLKAGDGRVELGCGTLAFQNWKQFEMRSYDASKNVWGFLYDNDFDRIKVICDFEVSGEVVYIRGFGERSGLWIEYKITSAELHFEFKINVQKGHLNDIGKSLQMQLDVGYDIERISQWAFAWYSDNIRELNASEKNLLRFLFTMEAGPEFEYSEKDLHKLADYLIEGVPDAIGKINRKKED